MNRSYSKKRHIQEVNQRLELRYLLKEQRITNENQIDLKYIFTLIENSPNKEKYVLKISELQRADCTDKLIAWLKWLYNERQKRIDKENEDTAIQAGVYQNKCFVNDAEATEMVKYILKQFYETELVHIKPQVSITEPRAETSTSTQVTTTPKKESIKNNVNPIQVGQQIPIYSDKNSQKLMGYVKVTKIIENPSSTTGLFTNSKFDAEIDVSVLPGFKFKFMDVIFRDFSFDGKSREETKESKENFTIYFSCQKEGLKIGNKKTKFRYTGVVFSPNITEFFSEKICNKSVVSDKTDVKSQEEISTPSSQSYYFAKDNKAVGPKTLQEIKNEIKLGTIRRETLVWKTGMPNWDKAENFLELKDSLGTLPPQLPSG